jgi:WD40 repeat protein
LTIARDFLLTGRFLQSSGVIADGAHDASELLNDVYRMLLAYYPPIDSHALHVYESAVATMPACALFSTVNTDTAAEARLVSGRQDSWTATLRIIEASRSFAPFPYAVTGLSFSPDGTKLASNSDHSTFKIWSARTGAQLAVLEMAERHSQTSEQAASHGVTDFIFKTCVVYSLDGTRIVCSFSSGSIAWLALWDTRMYQQLAVLRDPRDLMGHSITECLPVSFLPGSLSVVFGCDDGTIRVWDPAADTGALVFGGNATSKVWAIACAPDGSKIVSGLANGLLRVWDSRTGAALAALEGHSEKVNTVSFSPNGAQLASGSNDWSIRIWDVQTNEVISILRSHDYVTPLIAHAVTSVAFSPDGRQVISGSWDKTVRIWDVQSTKQITVLQGHHEEVVSVGFSPNGTLVASGSEDGTIRVWDMQTLSLSVDLPDDSNSESTHAIAISPNGARLLSTAGKSGRVWDMQTGQEIAVLDGHTDKIWVVAFSPDTNGMRIVTGSLDKTVRVWTTKTGQELARFSVDDTPRTVALSADGTRVVVGMDNARMPVWDVLSGEQLALLVGHRDDMSAVALSPDGLRVVSCSRDRTTRLWDVPSGDQVATIGEYEESTHMHGKAVAFSPDGLRVVVSLSGGLIQVWDTITGACVPLLEELNCSVSVVAYSFRDIWFSFDGRELRLAFDCGDIMIYQHGDDIQLDMPYLDDEEDLNLVRNLARCAITWDQTTGWFSCCSVPDDRGLLPLCWLPVERRGPALIFDRMVVVAGTGGKVTMLDFTKAIERLHNQGIVQSP